MCSSLLQIINHEDVRQQPFGHRRTAGGIAQNCFFEAEPVAHVPFVKLDFSQITNHLMKGVLILILKVFS